MNARTGLGRGDGQNKKEADMEQQPKAAPRPLKWALWGAGIVAVVGVAGSRLTTSPWEAVGLALIPGVAKELYDAGQDCNRFSWRDMGWNVAGAVAGVGGGYWMFGPSGVSWHTPF